MARQKRDALHVEKDVRKASTLPGSFYGDPAWHSRVRERVFARSWQLAGEAARIEAPGTVAPLTLLEGCLDEPLVLTRDAKGASHCLSNVCTHRGNLVCTAGDASGARTIRCGYHGRRFALDGRMHSMPEFEGARGFPSKADDLPRLPLERWSRFLFTGIDPAMPFADWIAPVVERAGWIDLSAAVFDPARSRDYDVQASWALYCDNYLEGFHVPFVHPGLAGALDYGSYRTELFEWSNLQVGIAKDGEDAFTLPADSPDRGQRVAAYYFWLFPNLMLNFYPWGLSLNLVQPLSPDRTRVAFRAFVADPSRLAKGAGAELDTVEREDEQVVEQVQKGVRSRLYDRGRYSPSHETGVHHFHRLLARALR